MQKSTKYLLLIFLSFFVFFTAGVNQTFGQCSNLQVLDSLAKINQARAPMASTAASRNVYLITAAEMAAAGFTAGDPINAIGWSYVTTPSLSLKGFLQLYLQNTTDAVYNKGNDYTVAVSGMTLVRNDSTITPTAKGYWDVNFTTAGFIYTGGGLYVANYWKNCVTPRASTIEVKINTSLANSIYTNFSTSICTSTSTIMTVSNQRPVTRFAKATIFYQDLDNDAHYNFTFACTSPGAGWLSSLPVNGIKGDCNDGNPLVWQNNILYRDADGDGYALNATTIDTCYGNFPAGYSITSAGIDCDDNNSSIWRIGTNLFYTDFDNDGYIESLNRSTQCYGNGAPPGYSLSAALGTDCDDFDSSIWRTGAFYTDFDDDGYTDGLNKISVCYGNDAPSGYSFTSLGRDANDNDPDSWFSDFFYWDLDSDGYHEAAQGLTYIEYGNTLPGAPYTLSSLGADCDDGNDQLRSTFSFYVDNDQDGFGSTEIVAGVCAYDANTPPPGYSKNKTDCDDTDPLLFQKFYFYPDTDFDGYGKGAAVLVCAESGSLPPFGYSLNNLDCNDDLDLNGDLINPDVEEICGDGIDNNCNGLIDEGFPKINVISNNVYLVDGNVATTQAGTNAGSMYVGSSLIKKITVRNTGSSSLSIYNISVWGLNSEDYLVEDIIYPLAIAVGDSLNFNITFAPNTPGISNGIILIDNEDCNQPAFSFDVKINALSCDFPTAPVFVTNQFTNCGIKSTTITIASGLLNDATQWKWYSGDCGSTLVGSGNSITVSPAATTFYFARGEGGCVTPNEFMCSGALVTVYNTATPAGNTTQQFCNAANVSNLTANGTQIKWYDSASSLTPLSSATPLINGKHYFASQTLNGCESPVRLDVSVIINVSTSTSTPITACDSFIWKGNTYYSSGIYTANSLNAAGCTHIDSLLLTINHSSTNEETITACDSFSWKGNTYYASGNYVVLGTNAAGCLLTSTLHLTINHSSTTTQTQVACDSFIWHGNTYYASGVKLFTSLNAEGCTNTDSLHLTINHSSVTTETILACDSFVWHGTTYFTGGDKIFTSLNAEGCINTDTLHLTINHSSQSSTTITACNSYIWNGTTYTTSGTYNYLTPNAAGCDSTAVLHLTILICNSYANITLNLQGAYDNTTHLMAPVLMNQQIDTSSAYVDSITIELHDPVTKAIVETAHGLLQVNGLLSLTFSPLNGNYYIAVKHRNTIETWSALPVAFSAGATTSYSFTSAASQAMGDNMIEVENGIWALYSGDVNADGNIDISDYSLWETDYNNLESGYLPTDINGDGNVDTSDYAIWESNYYNLINAVIP